MTLHDYLMLCRAPKIDLHMHLQGSCNLHVMSYLIQKNRHQVIAQIEDDEKLFARVSASPKLLEFLYSDSYDLDEESELFEYDSIQEFFLTYHFFNLFIRSLADLRLYLKGVIIKLQKQNVVHAEIIVSFPELIDQSIPAQSIILCLNEFKKTSPISINWWVDLVRHRGVTNAKKLLEVVVEKNKEGAIYGVNLGGDETSESLCAFSDVFFYAQENGLKISVHDGETHVVMNEKEYEKFDIDRVGHGLCYISNNTFQNGMIEVCLGSNYCTGIIGNIYLHPIFEDKKKLHNIVICTDDATFFKTNLAKELSYVLSYYGKAALIKVIGNALRCVDSINEEVILNWYHKNF